MTPDEIVKALRCCGNTDTKRPDCEHCPANGHMCVKHMLEGAADLIESLQANLAESQRRERAAVKIGDMLCEEVENCYGRETELTLKWRGPQEAGEEQGDDLDHSFAWNLDWLRHPAEEVHDGQTI